ncbi:hypothetical protein ACIQW7_24500 [Peribacillus simplex]|uniref:hypothetical protein n=1 Tax=Peribacillus simplex TaxID=1478 RepID=UPI0037FDB95D
MRIFDFISYEAITWIFGGIGVPLVGFGFKLLYKLWNKKRKKNQSNGRDSIKEDYLTNNSIEVYKGIDKIDEMVKRFLQIYEAHSIEKNQIPAFIDQKFQLKIKDFKDNQSILQVVDEELLNWTCEKFGVDRDWLDGTSDRIYSRNDYYKNVEKFIDDLCELIKENNNIEIYAFKNKTLNRDDRRAYVVLLIKYEIGKLNSNTIYRYEPVSTSWIWGHWRSRYQLKAIIYLCKKLKIYIKGCDLVQEYTIEDGSVFPGEFLNAFPITFTWYPEDYIDLISQNMQAVETDETEIVREYIKNEKYEDYLEEILDIKMSN